MRELFIALSLCIAPVVYAQSNPPAPSAAKEGQAPNAKAAKDQKRPSEKKKSALSSEPVTVNVYPPQVGQPPSQAQPYEHHHKADTDWWLVVPTILLMAFTGGLFFYTARLASETHKLARDGKETAQKELRAYVALDHLYFPTEAKTLPLGQTLHTMVKPLTVRIKNYGQTPSFDTSIWVDADTDKPSGLDAQSSGSGKQMLHPTMHYPVAIPEQGALGPYGQDGWVWGYMVYRDAFDQWWRTNFFYRYRPPFEGKGEGTFTPESQHNEEKGPYKSEEAALAGD